MSGSPVTTFCDPIESLFMAVSISTMCLSLPYQIMVTAMALGYDLVREAQPTSLTPLLVPLPTKLLGVPVQAGLLHTKLM